MDLTQASIDKDNLLQFITAQDLKSFGLIPELIGRLPVVSYLNPLDRNALRKILTEPKNALLKQYKKLFDMESIELEFKEGALISSWRKQWNSNWVPVACAASVKP